MKLLPAHLPVSEAPVLDRGQGQPEGRQHRPEVDPRPPGVRQRGHDPPQTHRYEI